MKFLLAVIVAAAMFVGVTAPAVAQGYTGWIEHPYPSAGLWWCEWVEDGGPYEGWTYWCNLPLYPTEPEGEWIWMRPNPDWYNASTAEMMRMFGQPVL